MLESSKIIRGGRTRRLSTGITRRLWTVMRIPKETFQNNKKLVLAALRFSPWAFPLASVTLQNDGEILALYELQKDK
jgi:hypothetical protein